jgi:hypothetical protein
LWPILVLQHFSALFLKWHNFWEYVIDFIEMNFLDRFSRNTQIPNFIKIRPVEDKLFIADRQKTDMMKPIVTFLKFVSMPKNTTHILHKAGLLL